jgi:hypothetical protein
MDFWYREEYEIEDTYSIWVLRYNYVLLAQSCSTVLTNKILTVSVHSVLAVYRVGTKCREINVAKFV